MVRIPGFRVSLFTVFLSYTLLVVGVKLDLEAWTDKFKILASNHTNSNRQSSQTVKYTHTHTYMAILKHMLL